ncbi:hypothetical protein ACWIUD_09675 [Helicobacter sp. 23-1044]
MQIGTEKRLIDANLNRLREGIRVVEDIARYILNDLSLASRLKTLRHRARIDNANLLDSLLQNRDIKNDILKKSTQSEIMRDSLRDIAIANFKRAQESARVLEEIFKLDFANGEKNAESTEDSAKITLDSATRTKNAESKIDSSLRVSEANAAIHRICERSKATIQEQKTRLPRFSSENLAMTNENSFAESTAICEIFKAIRYELYDIEITYFEVFCKG